MSVYMLCCVPGSRYGGDADALYMDVSLAVEAEKAGPQEGTSTHEDGPQVERHQQEVQELEEEGHHRTLVTTVTSLPHHHTLVTMVTSLPHHHTLVTTLTGLR